MGECLKQQEADMVNCGIDLAMRSSSICMMNAWGDVVVVTRPKPGQASTPFQLLPLERSSP